MRREDAAGWIDWYERAPIANRRVRGLLVPALALGALIALAKQSWLAWSGVPALDTACVTWPLFIAVRLRWTMTREDDMRRCLQVPFCFSCAYDCSGAAGLERPGLVTCPECGHRTPVGMPRGLERAPTRYAAESRAGPANR